MNLILTATTKYKPKATNVSSVLQTAYLRHRVMLEHGAMFQEFNFWEKLKKI